MVYLPTLILLRIKTKARLRLKPIIHPSNPISNPISNSHSNKILRPRTSDKRSNNSKCKVKHRISTHLHLLEAKAKNTGRLEDLVKAPVLELEAIKGTFKEEELVIWEASVEGNMDMLMANE
jgi:hypothetical protein